MLESRILEVFAYSNLSRIDFARQLNISNAVLSHISSGRNKAGMDLVLGVLTQFPEISPEWLLFGKGEMLKQENASKLIQWKDELIDIIHQISEQHQMLNQKIVELENKVRTLE